MQKFFLSIETWQNIKWNLYVIHVMKILKRWNTFKPKIADKSDIKKTVSDGVFSCNCTHQRPVRNSVKYVWWNLLPKYLTIESR